MKTRTRMGLILAVLTVVLSLGATTALAHGGHGRVGFGLGSSGGTATDLLTPAAKSLGVTVDALKKAILDDANARVDAAVKADRLDADQAADLKDDLAASPERAIALTTATGVARALGTTKAKLDDAFRAARKADLVARIDQAVKDGRIDDDQAADLKDALDDATLPGYRGGGGPGFGRGGFGLGHGLGFGGHGKGSGSSSGSKARGGSAQPA